jgi:NADPH:quinone reductase-like Zn-dependent oxidoreductase
MTETTPSTEFRTSTTRAAVINGYGGAEQLVVADIPVADPTDSQALIEVAAVSVNPVDLTTRAGRNIPESDARFPMVLGWDAAGTVLAVGSAVTDVKVGDRVAAMVFQPIDQRGTYAAHITLDADLLAHVPAELTLEQAATMPLAGLTASQLVDEALTDGAKTLLVTGALGAVGRHVVALAARAGVEVLGAVAAERVEELRALGANDAVGRDAFTAEVLAHHPAGVDAAIDLVGGTSSHGAFDAVRDGGRYATAVPPYIDKSGRFEDGKGIKIYVHTVHPDTARLTELLKLADDGILSTVVEAAYPLAEAAEAHRRQATGGLSGRVQILP